MVEEETENVNATENPMDVDIVKTTTAAIIEDTEGINCSLLQIELRAKGREMKE